MDISAETFQEHFTIREAAYHFVGFDVFDKKEIQARVRQLSASTSKADQSALKELQQQLKKADITYRALRRDLSNHVQEGTPTSLCITRLRPAEANSDNKLNIQYSRTYLSRQSLNIWFAEKGYETDKFAPIKPLNNEVIRGKKIEKLQSLLNPASDFYARELDLCIDVLLELAEDHSAITYNYGISIENFLLSKFADRITIEDDGTINKSLLERVKLLIKCKALNKKSPKNRKK